MGLRFCERPEGLVGNSPLKSTVQQPAFLLFTCFCVVVCVIVGGTCWATDRRPWTPCCPWWRTRSRWPRTSTAWWAGSTRTCSWSLTSLTHRAETTASCGERAGQGVGVQTDQPCFWRKRCTKDGFKVTNLQMTAHHTSEAQTGIYPFKAITQNKET